jgi:uncharacterized protein (DUF1778 family)
MAKTPPKRTREARGDVLRIRLTDDERRALDDAANSKNLETSTWARSELLNLARRLIGRKGG